MIVVEFASYESPILQQVSKAVPVLLSKDEDLDLAKGAISIWFKAKFGASDFLKYLDAGVDVVAFDFQDLKSLSTGQISSLLVGIPSERLALIFEPNANEPTVGPNFNQLSLVFKYFIVVNPHSVETVVNLKVNFPDNEFIVKRSENPIGLYEKGVDVLIDAERLSLDKESGKIDFVDLFLARSKSDRPDGLFSTIVTDCQGVALGLCYSSKESLQHALKTQSGVYWSRTRGLWYKGKTSGATQKLESIGLDCDGDALRFVVTQEAPGFCHLNTATCFGNDTGITGLYKTLEARLRDSPENSYTRRLFNDLGLLASKIKEEAEELVDAKTKDEVAWEAADLLYFAFVKCVKEGISLSDIEKHLDSRSKKITRRPGNAKEKFIVPTVEEPPKQVLPDFHMNVYQKSEQDISTLNKLLIRPILNTTEILDRVKPIMAQVRKQGDAAIIELTKKFDGVEMDSVVINAPFDESLMVVDPKVKAAIDLACENVEKFHVAQLKEPTLVVETMPGVTCSRFIRPIEKVGLYVPGGTAILPSSAMMLGIPAKAAGCSEIVIATPPRKDGSIAPEVVYVAHKVGASMIVKAGGAQAVAAMAYGTESVTKVDKICGPGNQYVTQAKMLAQVTNINFRVTIRLFYQSICQPVQVSF